MSKVHYATDTPVDEAVEVRINRAASGGGDRSVARAVRLADRVRNGIGLVKEVR